MPAAPRLLLASRSPRRRLLLAEAGYAFDAIDPPFDDPDTVEHGASSAADHAVSLATAKAKSLVHAWQTRDAAPAVVLAADTVCVDASGRGIGKPTSAEEARGMLRGFVAATHEVVTGVSLLRVEDARVTAEQAFAESAAVTWGEIDEDAIEAYLAGGAWAGKAGGYNLFDRRDAGWPIAVEGEETCVVGLPMARVRRALAALGVVPGVDAAVGGSRR